MRAIAQKTERRGAPLSYPLFFPASAFKNVYGDSLSPSYFFSCSQLWLPTVQEVLQADWQEVWHSPQPPFFTDSCRFLVAIVLICFIMFDFPYFPYYYLLCGFPHMYVRHACAKCMCGTYVRFPAERTALSP